MAKGDRASSRRFERVVGLGLCVVDEVLLVEDLGLGTPRLRYHERRRLPGGMVTTALAQAARLGCRAELISAVGDDEDGRFLARELRRRGVTTRGLRRSAKHATTTAVVLVERGSGERRFLLPARRPIESAVIDLGLASVRRGALLLVDGHFAAPALRAVRLARARAVPVIGDFADARPGIRRLLPFVDYPIVPEEFVAAFGAGGVRETLHALQRLGGGTPVVTQGARGALVLHSGRLRRVRARRVRVVDTTGAGDAFHGAFAVGLARGLDVLRALEGAAYAATRACRALGGMGELANSLGPRGARRSRSR